MTYSGNETVCRICGEQIPAKENLLESFSNNPKTKTLAIALSISALLAVGLFGLKTLTADRVNQGADKAVSTQAPVENLEIGKVFNAFRENPIAADEMYLGKTFSFEGMIGTIDKLSTIYNVSVILNTNGTREQVFCEFSLDEKSRLQVLGLKRGSKAVLVGVLKENWEHPYPIAGKKDPWTLIFNYCGVVEQ
jgi:hypothetical protein